MYNTKFAILTVFEYISGIKYIHNVVQPSPLTISKAVYHLKQKLCNH